MKSELSTALAAEWTWTGAGFERDVAAIQQDGRIAFVPAATVPSAERFPRMALLPAFINAHSHTFQRVIRGRTEHRTRSDRDTFWTWREKMYRAALTLTPDDLYDAARMAFLEMTLAGTAWVGEFHYVHHQPDGTAYPEPNHTAQVIARAAAEIGLGIVMLVTGYQRGGFRRELHPAQRRFCTEDPDTLCARIDALSREMRVGVAPHSLRAVPLCYAQRLHAFASERGLPFHLHASEQPGENSDVLAEHGATPVTLLHRAGLLNAQTTLVHAVHLTDAEIAAVGASGATVCACPTTERNLGDGIVPADRLLAAGATLALGSDSQIQIDPLEDARELEYHLRLGRLERAALAPADDLTANAVASRLFAAATDGGARSLGLDRWRERADFITVDLDDPSIAGAEDEALLAAIVFSLERTAIRDVWVGGRRVVRDGRHSLAAEVTARFRALQSRLWS